MRMICLPYRFHGLTVLNNFVVLHTERLSRVMARTCALHGAIRWCLAMFMSAFVCLPLAAQTNTPAADKPAANTASSEIPAPSSISQKPRWEIGIGGGYFSGFDYPASSDSNERAIALPFFIYRTPLFRFGGGGIRAVAVERPRLKLDLSIGGSLNASSQGNSAREGMPDLDFLFEIGPQLEIRLLDRRLSSGSRVLARFTSELRAVFSTDFRGVDSQGVVADIGVGLNVGDIAGSGITFITGVDATFATESLHDYFYQVDPEFVTDTRPLFDASGGYLESNVFVGFAMRPFSQVRVFTGVSKGFFNGASNEDSPLFDVREQTRYALGIVWTIKTSKRMVDIVDLGGNN